MYECAVHFDALHLICHVFDFSHAFVILYLIVIDAIKNILNLNLNISLWGLHDLVDSSIMEKHRTMSVYILFEYILQDSMELRRWPSYLGDQELIF